MQHRDRRRTAALVTGALVMAMSLSSCSDSEPSATATAGTPSDSSQAESLIIGTTDQITAIDPAGSYDLGSFVVQTQVFAYLLNTQYGSSEVEPDLAASAEFTSPTEYTVVLKPGLTFANGHALTSSDVKFTFDRQLAIFASGADNGNGPGSLLYNLDSVAAPDELTVVFTLKSANDQVFPQVLSSPVGPIVDEEVFSADSITPDAEIVAANAFNGQYVITSYDQNNLVSYEANPAYAGLWGPALTQTIDARYYADESNLKLDIQQGNIDVAFRSLSAQVIGDLRGDQNVKVVDGPGGEIRYLVFNFDTQPYGATTSDADPAKALAVRQAIASLIDRQQLASQVYQDSYTPLFSYVPAGLTGATESLKELYGDGQGAPDPEKAAQILEAAGVTTPVTIKLQYSPDHFGASSADEYALIKDQLESSGLFAVDLQSTEWVTYSKERVADAYPVYQLGWFPDYSDADNYLTPFFLLDNFLGNHYASQEVNDLILKQAVTVDPAERTAVIEDIQDKVAADLPTLPILQGAQVAVTGPSVEGADTTLDASFKFRYAALTKSS